MTYFCKPNGVGNGTTMEQAGEFTELAKNLRSGDILYVCGGTYYYKEQITLDLKGEPNNEILIVADDFTDLPVFDFRYQIYGSRSSNDGNGFRLFGEYVRINSIVIAYAGYKGIRSELSNSILENIEVYGACDSGIHMCSGGNNKLINCVSHDNFGYRRADYEVMKFGYDSDGISDKLHYGLPNKMINCKSYNNTDDGFDFFGRCTEEFTYLEGCESWGNGASMFNMVDYPRYEVDRDWFDGFKEPKMYKTVSGDTLISLENYPAFGNGNGFKLGGNKRYHCVEVHNCKASDNKMKGFDQNHNSGIMKLYDCYGEGNKMYDFGFRNEDCGNVSLYNCVSKTNKVDIRTKVHSSIDCSWN